MQKVNREFTPFLLLARTVLLCSEYITTRPATGGDNNPYGLESTEDGLHSTRTGN